MFEELFLLALGVTVLIETTVLLILLKVFRVGDSKATTAQIIFAGILASATTLPYIWFIIPRFVDSAQYVLVGESLIVIAEAVILNRVLGLKITTSLLVSLACNAASYAIGQLIF